MYKIARMSCGMLASIITVLTSSSLLFVYYEGGNLSEEYAMPCIAIGIYYFLDYLMNNEITKTRLILSGICCGIVLMLRPNMVTVWFVYCLTITVILIFKNSIKDWTAFAIWFVVGVAIMVIPVIIWLGINHDLKYFVHDYIIFNMQYSSAEGGRALFSSKWSSFFEFFNSTIFITAFCSLVFHLKRKEKLLLVSYLLYLALTIVFMVMSGMSYAHYGMILIPAVVYPISLIFADIEKISDKNTANTILMLSSLYLLSVVIIPNWIGIISGIVTMYEKKGENHQNDVTVNITKIIDENTKEEDRISVYGNWNIIYVLSDRMHATRYSYQFPIGQVVPKIMDEYIEDLQLELPKAIVIQPGRYDDTIKTFLKNNNYHLYYLSEKEDINSGALLFFKQ